MEFFIFDERNINLYIWVCILEMYIKILRKCILFVCLGIYVKERNYGIFKGIVIKGLFLCFFVREVLKKIYRLIRRCWLNIILKFKDV